MPAREQSQPKRRKVDVSSKQTYKCSSARDIQRVLKAQSEAGLIEGVSHPCPLSEELKLTTQEGLTALRNQFTVKTSESSVAVNDERLLLAKEWLEADPGAQELLNIWETANAVRHSRLSTPCFISLHV